MNLVDDIKTIAQVAIENVEILQDATSKTRLRVLVIDEVAMLHVRMTQRNIPAPLQAAAVSAWLQFLFEREKDNE